MFLSCCPFFRSKSAVDTDEDNAPYHDSRATELATVVSFGTHPDHKETASQISSKHDSSYDNISSFEKTEAAVIHEASTPENKDVKSGNVQNQKEIENTYEKPKAIGLGNYCQATTHVPDSTTSAAQQLCEVDSVSSTSRHRVENNAEVKAQHVDPPIQRLPEPTENHQLPVTTQHYVGLQHSFKQESVPSQKAKMSDIHQENILSLHLSKFQEDPSERQQDTSMKANRPVGLQNLGNTCFFNAVMQNLNQSFLLCEVLAEKGCRFSLTQSMLGFYEQMCPGNSTVNPHEVLKYICQRSPRFAGGHQQDSHELLRHLLDGLRTEEREFLGNANNRKILTKVDKVFGGHFMTVYTCRDCKTPYHVCEPMLDISLPIAYEDFQTDEESSVNEEDGETAGDGVMYKKMAEFIMMPLAVKQKKDAQDNCNEYGPEAEAQQQSKKNNNKRKNKDKSDVQHSATEKRRRKQRSILDCLDAFTRTEHIADEYLCMACHAQRVNEGATDYQKTSAKKRTLIYNPPALLTLHLKRFEQTPRGFVKCNKSISFQDMIDIGPYCSSWCMRNEGNEKSIWYSLYGLVVHSGSLDGGHYVAYIKLRETEDNMRQFLQESYLDRDQLTEETLVEMMKEMHGLHKPNQSEKWQPQPVKGDWFCVSDSHFSPVSEEEVWEQQAYLLFYERMQGRNGSLCYRRDEETHF